MTAFGLLPGPLDGVKLTVDRLMEDGEEEIETIDLSGLEGFDIDEYRQRDDVEVERTIRDDGREAYRVVPHSEEARALLDPSNYSEESDSEISEPSSDLGPQNPSEPNNGGDNNMVDSPDELVDLSDDVDAAQQDMYDKLGGFRDYLEEKFQEVDDEIEVTLREAAEVLDYMDDTMGAQLNTQLHDYETVSDYVEAVSSDVDEHVDEVVAHLDEDFRDTDKYAEVRRNMEAMDQRRNRFRDEMGLN
ncbi:hypothetical protein [Candidatus Nanohalovita haloferacivicina]|uniref:hypothetical protein n=1 Tax=Candidatus Nanohalovita haloferacivicina TaxID=2978046 RepID=UPI00325FD061|nr:hypothetical protein HBNXNv_1094 [Candidatus Nanohalobia archaeon BNXNv]